VRHRNERTEGEEKNGAKVGTIGRRVAIFSHDHYYTNVPRGTKRKRRRSDIIEERKKAAKAFL
jgi:hypothetical protein